jgi:hypothetical protein
MARMLSATPNRLRFNPIPLDDIIAAGVATPAPNCCLLRRHDACYKIAPRQLCPPIAGHRQIHDLSQSFRVVYGSDRLRGIADAQNRRWPAMAHPSSNRCHNCPLGALRLDWPPRRRTARKPPRWSGAARAEQLVDGLGGKGRIQSGEEVCHRRVLLVTRHAVFSHMSSRRRRSPGRNVSGHVPWNRYCRLSVGHR